ncbi:CbtA family protein [Actinomadura barringtoniae]|uniref:CbtA family protein n=1 Tax=Actinomadura barringtoniae TaxID=1427535 RepID=A0A939P8F0_9ACTN|nr:CbtA family protein [Actinomadura barringtoniae]MBO2447598.1 CbtA family protein [Actinomadura barringtoniae]
MERKFIVRGILAGIIAGLLAFVFARIFAEPQIQAAIDYESGRDAAQHVLDQAKGVPMESEHSDPFSRTVQGNAGIGVGIVAFGAAMGGIFAVAFMLAAGRTGKLRPRTLAMLTALGGFLGFFMLPFLKYPANPPAIGHEETIKDRSGLFLLMVCVSIVLLVLAVWAGQRLRPRFGTWNATLLAIAGGAVVLGVVMLLLPSLGELSANVKEYGKHATETPQPLTDDQGKIVYPGFPADVLFKFRLYSVGAQLILWAGIGLIFAPMAERLLGKAGSQPAGSPVEEAPASA